MCFSSTYCHTYANLVDVFQLYFQSYRLMIQLMCFSTIAITTLTFYLMKHHNFISLKIEQFNKSQISNGNMLNFTTKA